MNDNVTMIEKKVLSSDGEHQLAGRVYVPEGEPVGVFQVVHGMTEHIARYDAFMREISSHGFVVFGYDHLGHGLTARNDGELGFIAHRDGWRRLVDDVERFAAEVRAEYGEALPYILMGHSMGSFIVRMTAATYDRHDRLIIMGTGGPNPAAGAGLAMIKIIKALRGERYVSDFIYSVAFGKYNDRFADENDIYAWLSKIRSVREAYAADKFCTFKFTVSAMGDLISVNRASNAKSWARTMNKTKPVLLVSGSDDPVGDYGRGVTAVRDMLVTAGVPAEMKLYDGCRHEILNETCRDDVIKDILAFIGV